MKKYVVAEYEGIRMYSEDYVHKLENKLKYSLTFDEVISLCEAYLANSPIEHTAEEILEDIIGHVIEQKEELDKEEF